MRVPKAPVEKKKTRHLEKKCESGRRVRVSALEIGEEEDVDPRDKTMTQDEEMAASPTRCVACAI